MQRLLAAHIYSIAICIQHLKDLYTHVVIGYLYRACEESLYPYVAYHLMQFISLKKKVKYSIMFVTFEIGLLKHYLCQQQHVFHSQMTHTLYGMINT